LPLLVPRVLADDPHNPLAFDHLALLADRFHRRPHLQDSLQQSAISHQLSAEAPQSWPL